MWRNPYVIAGSDPVYAEEHGEILATLTLAYEQYMRNKIAYLTLTHREWYDGDEELDEYFRE